MKRALSKVICAMLAAASLGTCTNVFSAVAANNINVEKSVSASREYQLDALAYSPKSANAGDDFFVFADAAANMGDDFFVCEDEAADAGILTEYEEYVDSSGEIKVGSRFWELFFGKSEPKTLIAAGDVFGIKLKQRHPTVVDAPGVPALRSGDAIISINGQKIGSAAELKEAIRGCGGESVSITALRGDERINLEIVPRLEGDEYRIGITLKDVTAGIGTITFIDPETLEFGGLGHGICAAEGGKLIDMTEGIATEVALGGIHKGEAGSPGELSGVIADTSCGEIYLNTDVGVFGKLNSVSEKLRGSIFEVATKGDVAAGEATIISTVKNGKKAEYKIEIYDIDKSSTGSKSFKIKVKDPALLAITGGIVRGMSGSPIIQNGKLVGAVTHVLVNDPTVGYGIFIENMLNAAKTPMAKAS